MVNSNNKGKVGERAWRDQLRAMGFPKARRGRQYSGGPESPDVVGIKGLHAEVKRVERLSIYEAMAQSIKDSGDNIPYVAHRRNHKQWLVTVQAEDLIEFCQRFLAALP